VLTQVESIAAYGEGIVGHDARGVLDAMRAGRAMRSGLAGAARAALKLPVATSTGSRSVDN
jgi:hypothetical protein